MCNHNRNPVHCFLPPYMVAKLKKNKDHEVSENAKRNSELSKKLRYVRKYITSRKADMQEMFLENPVNLGANSPDIEICNSNHTQNTPGDTMNNAVGDADFVNVKKNLEIAWKFYFDVFARNSFNNKGARIISSIHFSNQFNNAHWDGKQLVFGDGDGINFKSFTLDIDLVGHEFTHGVSPVKTPLDYMGQSGALVESFSDVMGILVKHRSMNLDVKQSNWLMGENVLMNNGFAIRSLKEPGTAYVNHPVLGRDPQPKIFDPGIPVNDVHKFCGIPNHAFYVAAFDIGGNAWEKAGRIWYGAYMELEFPKTNFSMFRDATVKKAAELFPGGPEIQAVEKGWDEAGVLPFQPN
jgi:Zn-dependent metalloprotease